MKNLNRILVLLGAFAGLYLAVLLIAFFRVFTEASDDISHWANFGDFLGGSTGPLFGLFSLFAILYTIGIQTKEVSRSSREQSTANSYSRMNAITALIAHYKEQEALASACAKRFQEQDPGPQAEAEAAGYRKRRRKLEYELERYYGELAGSQTVVGR